MDISFNVKYRMSKKIIFDNQAGYSSHFVVELDEIKRIKPVLAEYFSTDDSPSVEVIIETEIVSDENLVPVERYKKNEEMSESLKCLLKDLKNEESCVFIALAPSYQNLGIVEQKVEIACALFQSYIAYKDSVSSNMNDETLLYLVSYYCRDAYYKFFLPKDLVIDTFRTIKRIDLLQLSTENLSKFVIPAYYSDLGMWDREYIREDDKLMNMLSVKWLDMSRHPDLD